MMSKEAPSDRRPLKSRSWRIFLGPMAKPQRMAILTAVCAAGIVLPDEWMHLNGIGVMNVVLGVIVGGGAVTVVRRLRRASEHLRNVAQESR